MGVYSTGECSMFGWWVKIIHANVNNLEDFAPLPLSEHLFTVLYFVNAPLTDKKSTNLNLSLHCPLPPLPLKSSGP